MRYEVVLGEWDSFVNDGLKYDLIYLDPPFFTQKRHKMEQDNKTIFFDDIWDNISEYNMWLKNVFETCWNNLSDTGLIYSHNNFEMNAYLLSSIDDNIRSKFITNISWQRSHPHNNIKNNWGNIVDSIMMFSKSNRNYFNVQYNKLDSKYENGSFNKSDDVGKYALAPITGEKSRIGYKFEYNGYNPKYGWRKDLQDIKDLDSKNLLYFGKNKPYRKTYLSESKGSPIQNIWSDISPITRSEKNKREYPTQKPVKLLERIIGSSCPIGGKILDPFGGSGTTLLAGINTKIPSYIKIIDKNPDSIDLINKIKTD
jgi:DNA modification methylase